MIALTSLTMQIIDSDPDGIKICRVAGSTLVTVVVPRELLRTAKELPDIPARGVYYLLDDHKGRLKRVYAGQTVQGVERLDNHKSTKPWWNKAVMFLAPDNEFSMDIVSGLEVKAIEYIREHGVYDVENTVDPHPYVNPYNEAFINRLHEEILFRMTLLGFNLDAVGDTEGDIVDELFHTSRRGVTAYGRYNSEEGTFDVLEGSCIDFLSVPGTKNSPIEKLVQSRESLLASGEIGVDESGVYVLKTRVQFTSPSAAAEFVLGGSCNGWTEWKNDNGQTLSWVYRENKDLAR